MRAKGNERDAAGGNVESFVIVTSTKKNIPSAEALKSRSGECFIFSISNGVLNHTGVSSEHLVSFQEGADPADTEQPSVIRCIKDASL